MLGSLGATKTSRLDALRGWISRWANSVARKTRTLLRARMCSWAKYKHPADLGGIGTLASHHAGTQDQLPSIHCAFIPSQRF